MFPKLPGEMEEQSPWEDLVKLKVCGMVVPTERELTQCMYFVRAKL